jgi:hypothetical protein
MVDALVDEAVDVVLQWSIWPETFGITARECSAAGVVMVVAESSGAVADHVRARGGWVLASEAELLPLFDGDDLFEQVSMRRHEGAPVGTLRWSGLTSELVSRAAAKEKV